jgi:hypothetical protein
VFKTASFGVNERDFMVFVKCAIGSAVPHRYAFEKPILEAYSRLDAKVASCIRRWRRNTDPDFQVDDVIREISDDSELELLGANDADENDDEEEGSGSRGGEEGILDSPADKADLRLCRQYIRNNLNMNTTYQQHLFECGESMRPGLRKLYTDAKKYKGNGLQVLELVGHSGICPKGEYHEEPQSIIRLAKRVFNSPGLQLIWKCQVCNSILRLPVSVMLGRVDKASRFMFTADSEGKQVPDPEYVRRNTNSRVQKLTQAHKHDFDILQHLMHTDRTLIAEESDDDEDAALEENRILSSLSQKGQRVHRRYLTFQDKWVQISEETALKINDGIMSYLQHKAILREV